MRSTHSIAVAAHYSHDSSKYSLQQCQTPVFSSTYMFRRGEFMCETNRRCPGCNSPSALDRHNWRRRQNRGVQKALRSWANNEENVKDPGVREFVQKLPPGRAKQWAKDAGAPTWIAQPAHTNPQKPDTPPPGLKWTPCSHNYPQTRAAIATALSIQGKSGKGPEERRLLTAKIVDSTDHSQGVNETRRVEFADGGEGFFKPLAGQEIDNEISLGHEYSMQAQHEVATWKVAQQLGPRYTEMVPPTVLREVNGELGTLSKKYPGEDFSPFTDRNQLDPQQVHDAAVFDAITGQRDRHPGNTLVYRRTPEHLGITLIDHGYSFTRIGEYSHNFSVWRIYQQGERYTNDSSLTDAHIEDLKRLRATNLDFLRGIVHPDRILDRLTHIDCMIELKRLPPIPTAGKF